MRVSYAGRQKCLDIMNRLDGHIPVTGYVKPVQLKLKEKGEIFSENQIIATRNRRAFHIKVAETFEALFDPEKSNKETTAA